MDNNKFILYQYKNITISRAKPSDGIEIFEAFENEFRENKEHTYDYIMFRHSLKIKVKTLISDMNCFVVKKDNIFAGFFQIFPPTKMHGPEVSEVFILKKYRKTKILACMIDYVMNNLYANQNIITFSELYPGFKKIVREFFQFATIRAVLTDTKYRAQKICDGAITHGIL
jgi:hypothetical protein